LAWAANRGWQYQAHLLGLVTILFSIVIFYIT
jgi:hypothetical protein